MTLETIERQTERYARSLKAVPVRNKEVRVVQDVPGGELHLEVKLSYSPVLGFFRSLLGARRTKTYVLEGVGRGVYESVDGEKDFEALIDEFAAKHKLTFLESRALLAQYLQLLTKRGLIVAVMRTRKG